MPIYEYFCTECGSRIEVTATLHEEEKGLKVICPDCNSDKTARIFGQFSVVNTSKSNSSTPLCGPQSRPNCCR